MHHSPAWAVIRSGDSRQLTVAIQIASTCTGSTEINNVFGLFIVLITVWTMTTMQIMSMSFKLHLEMLKQVSHFHSIGLYP